MTNKLLSIAKMFVHEVGNKLPHYTFVFPNHRAGLFFQKYLAQHVQQPIFAPQIQTINECFAELSNLLHVNLFFLESFILNFNFL